MPFQLKRSNTGREHFIGNPGSEVTVKVTAPAGGACEILHIQYATDPVDSVPPMICRLTGGRKPLFVLVEAFPAGTLLNVLEVDDAGNEQVLDHFHFDPMNPARGYIISAE